MRRSKGLIKKLFVQLRFWRDWLYLMSLGVTKKSFQTQRGDSVVVNLTTYPKRLSSIKPVIASLLSQSIRPDRTILWISSDELDREHVESFLSWYVELGLEIRAVPANIRSYKKLVPALRELPNYVHITVDDDVSYPRNFLRGLLEDHKSHPDCILGFRGHRMTWDKDGGLLPYVQWQHNVRAGGEGDDLLLTGNFGILYPQGCFGQKVLEEKIFMETAPGADDIWFKCMALLYNRGTRVVAGRVGAFIELPDLDGQPLSHQNVGWGDNDRQMAALIERLGIDISRISRRCSDFQGLPKH